MLIRTDVGEGGTSPRSLWAERLSAGIPRVYARGEKTVAEIAEMFRVTEKTVLKYLDAGIRERRRHDVRVLHLRGWGRLGIGDVLGLSPSTVSDYLRELELESEIESSACPHCGR